MAINDEAIHPPGFLLNKDETPEMGWFSIQNGGHICQPRLTRSKRGCEAHGTDGSWREDERRAMRSHWVSTFRLNFLRMPSGKLT